LSAGLPVDVGKTYYEAIEPNPEAAEAKYQRDQALKRMQEE